LSPADHYGNVLWPGEQVAALAMGSRPSPERRPAPQRCWLAGSAPGHGV